MMNSRDRNALAVGGAILFAVFFLPAISQRLQVLTNALETRHRNAHSRIAALQRLRQSRTSLNAEMMHSLNRAKAIDTLLIPGRSLPDASANFVAVLTEGARASKLMVNTLRIDADTGRSNNRNSSRMLPFVRLSARMSISGDFESMLTFLEWIETSPPSLGVADAVFTPSKSNGAPEQLQATLRIDATTRVNAVASPSTAADTLAPGAR